MRLKSYLTGKNYFMLEHHLIEKFGKSTLNGNVFPVQDVRYKQVENWRYNQLTGYFYRVREEFDENVSPFHKIILPMGKNDSFSVFSPAHDDMMLHTNDYQSIDRPHVIVTPNYTVSDYDCNLELEQFPDIFCSLSKQYNTIIRFPDWTYKVYSFQYNGNYQTHKVFKSYQEAVNYAEFRSDLRNFRIINFRKQVLLDLQSTNIVAPLQNDYVWYIEVYANRHVKSLGLSRMIEVKKSKYKLLNGLTYNISDIGGYLNSHSATRDDCAIFMFSVTRKGWVNQILPDDSLVKLDSMFKSCELPDFDVKPLILDDFIAEYYILLHKR